MLSIIIASVFLPFLPLLPIHILIQNLLNDFAQIGMPFDDVDDEYIEKPKAWDTNGIKRFMFKFGLISTVLDILCFGVLWFIMKFNTADKVALFQTGWFAFGIISQTWIIHMIRTHKIPFVQSKSSKQLLISTFAIMLLTMIITFTHLATGFDLYKLPYSYLIWIIVLLCIYTFFIQIYKKIHLRNNNEWL